MAARATADGWPATDDRLWGRACFGACRLVDTFLPEYFLGYAFIRSAIGSNLPEFRSVKVRAILGVAVARLPVLAGTGALAVAVTGAGYQQTEDALNLEVLEGVPPGQLQLIMEATAVSLGVECEHCHVAGAFEQIGRAHV